VPLPFAAVQGQRATASVAGQMQLGRQSPAATAQALARGGSKRGVPLFLRECGAPRRRADAPGRWCCRSTRRTTPLRPRARLALAIPGVRGSRSPAVSSGESASGWCSTCHNVPGYPAKALPSGRATASRSPTAGAGGAACRPSGSAAVAGVPGAPTLGQLNLHVP
jgi:hypothetical protein